MEEKDPVDGALSEDVELSLATEVVLRAGGSSTGTKNVAPPPADPPCGTYKYLIKTRAAGAVARARDRNRCLGGARPRRSCPWRQPPVAASRSLEKLRSDFSRASAKSSSPPAAQQFPRSTQTGPN
ncbi:hypothetical protein TPAR_07812 [Tolypocladium paradoxum]|uniref:Uncharacterized protein n=1 Tax=Tolypocladium paradoxum TaxID=94208 RepID=A0A2S4KP84_9HYPO|nr:hypothetical protein TPAR_07812 [Tolypocladium paradoxum]